MKHEDVLTEVHQRLGYRRLQRGWAKAEVFLGLLAVGIGVFTSQFALAQSSPWWELVLPALALFVLGGYLALAGHRSHLYQSANDRLVLLIEEMRQLHAKGTP